MTQDTDTEDADIQKLKTKKQREIKELAIIACNEAVRVLAKRAGTLDHQGALATAQAAESLAKATASLAMIKIVE